MVIKSKRPRTDVVKTEIVAAIREMRSSYNRMFAALEDMPDVDLKDLTEARAHMERALTALERAVVRPS